MPDRAAIFKMGREGDASTQPELARVLFKARDPQLRAEAGLAIANQGFRKIPYAADTLAAIRNQAADPDAGVRFAVAYAIFRNVDEPDQVMGRTLQNLAKDPDPEVRAMTLRAAARSPLASPELFANALNDSDWRVRVEAVRGLSHDKSTPEARAMLAAWLVTAQQDPHAVEEAFARLRKYAAEEKVKPAFAERPSCLAAAGRVTAGASIDELLKCAWPEWRKLPLAASLLKDNLGADEKTRAKLLAKWSKHKDARVRAAAGEAAALTDEKVAVALLKDKQPFVVATMLETIATAVAEGKTVPPKTLAAASKKALAPTNDAEVLLTNLEYLAKVKPEGAMAVAEKALSFPNKTIREKAKEVIVALGGTPADVQVAADPALPFDPKLANTAQRLVVKTSKGTFKIELRGDLAPLNVANLVTLAQKKLYDKTIFHRVVPNFVIQGGDPTGSGWGGPGYSVKAEPSSEPYSRGAVGIADAGPDTGGSQWFVMHSRAPHLEGRYTLVGRVTEGLDVVDMIQIGDTVDSVTVEWMVSDPK
jgi:cyclophilin family peptidyl-prolyl cis-trans isomerase